MGALTGNTVQSTYLDLVQLGQSGAGLPSHAGKEAALYDGSGAQILGRTAVRHWLDPHPDAIAGSWEFSTYGDATQAALEAAGWTFTNCTGVVEDGMMWITESGAGSVIWMASLDVALTGDFDLVLTPSAPIEYLDAAPGTPLNFCGFGVADYRAGVADVAHYILGTQVNGISQIDRYINGAYTTLGGTSETDAVYGYPLVLRIYRRSGVVEPAGGAMGFPSASRLVHDTTSPQNYGWTNTGGVSDASTFNKLFFTMISAATSPPCKFGIASIRRFQ